MRAQKAFLIPFLIVWSIGLYFSLSVDKLELHYWMNQIQTEVLFPFFWVLTNLGDGIAIAIYCVIALFLNVRTGIVLALISGLDGIIVQLLKRNVFNDFHRPPHYFDQMPSLSLMESIEMHHHFSFPSGHTSAAFAFFFGLSLFSKNRLIQFTCFTMATLIAYSRIYLSQHFLMDTVAGSILGVILALACYFFIVEKDKFPKLNRPLIRF